MKMRNSVLFACILLMHVPVHAADNGRGIRPDAALTPDNPTEITISNSDINKIRCENGKVNDVRTSAEKGVQVDVAGSNIFVKFNIRQIEEKVEYVTKRTEFYITCNGVDYMLYALPRLIAGRTVRLVGGAEQRAQENLALFGAMSDEERAVNLSERIITENVPRSFKIVSVVDQVMPGPIAGITIVPRRRYSLEGGEMSIGEYLVRSDRSVTLDETMFLMPALGANMYSITLERLSLEAGQASRLIIVYRGDF